MFSPRIARLNLLESMLRTFDRSRSARESDHRETKRAGKTAAFFYLRRTGLTVVARDWNDGKSSSSIDLIAWDWGTLCFVDVQVHTSRPRSSAVVDSSYSQPMTSKLIARYLMLVPEGTPHRCDILRVFPPGEEPCDPEHRGRKWQKRSAEFEYLRDVNHVPPEP